MTLIRKAQECGRNLPLSYDGMTFFPFSNKSFKTSGVPQMFSWTRREEMMKTGESAAALTTEVKWIPRESRTRRNTTIAVTHTSTAA